MENKNEPAYPSGGSFDSEGRECNSGWPGLTKREYFAGLAMQGLLANDWQGYAKRSEECDVLAQTAVNFADALLTSLSGETK